VRGTLQIGSAAVIHERTGRPVVSDFRRADLAAGGQGAPLTPFFHYYRFADADERRAVLNIGGFTNVSYLPGRDPKAVLAFDPGPGNALLDRAARWASNGRERIDRDGARASRGRVHEALLEEWLADPTSRAGRQEHGPRASAERSSRARDAVLAAGGSPTTCSRRWRAHGRGVARGRALLPERAERWILYGGGVHNRALVEGLRARVAPAPLETTDAWGVPSGALEAIAFAVLGHCASLGLPSNLPAATGAARAVCLGALNPPDAFRASPASDR
jgi:anhydro-N-acetylmuramic acid kinase